MDFRHHFGPWALVAGASEGLGAAWAHALAKRGLNLVLVARREGPLGEVASALRERHGVEVQPVTCDLATPKVWETLAPALDDREVCLYVHNAAFAPHGDFLERPVDDALTSVAVSCRAPVLLAHHLGKRMAQRGRGGVILMSSLTAFQGTPLLTAYGAAKAFNLTFAEGLNAELKPRGVAVLACCAGATRTPGFERSSPDGAPGLLEPEQVVEAALAQLGRHAIVIPGAFNRFASFFMRRLLPRTAAVNLLAAQAKKLRQLP